MVDEKIQAIVELFKKHKPTTAKEIRKLGIKMHKITSGAFRDVYVFNDLPLVVKIPRTNWEHTPNENLEHAQDEIKAYKAVFKKKALKALRPFMPQFYYMDYKHGVVLAEKYRRLSESRVTNIIQNLFGQLLEELTALDPNYDLDIHSANIAKDAYGNYKFIDLGMLIAGV